MESTPNAISAKWGEAGSQESGGDGWEVTQKSKLRGEGGLAFPCGEGHWGLCVVTEHLKCIRKRRHLI